MNNKSSSNFGTTVAIGFFGFIASFVCYLAYHSYMESICDGRVFCILSQGPKYDTLVMLSCVGVVAIFQFAVGILYSIGKYATDVASLKK